MFIITNRVVQSGNGFDTFGDTPSPKGPNELRVVEATKVGGHWNLTLHPDEITDAMKAEVGITSSDPCYASVYAARKTLASVQKNERNLLFFVHGYNNNMKDVLERAWTFQHLYGVEVIVFSWPANGGGIRGVASYLSDKRDARVSAGALDRTLTKMAGLLDEFNADRVARIQKLAEKKFDKDAESRDRFVAKEVEKGCPFTINLALHSMGNYVFKQVMESSAYESSSRLLFDNVVLVAADTNNEGHASWVDRIKARSRIFITINERDIALRASRMKFGDEQKARLGHYRYCLDSTKAAYVDFTKAKYVGDSHAYFEGTPAAKNANIRRFFKGALNGDRAEAALSFDASTRMYTVA